MKKCEHVKDLILTDYMDGRMDAASAGSLEGHLLDCSDCRAFFKEVRDSAVEPLHKTALQPVPDGLWSAVRESLEAEERPVDPLEGFFGALTGWLAFPKLVPVAASLVLVLLVWSVSLNTLQLPQGQDREQGEYLVSLMAPAGLSTAENNDPATPIESYFL